MTKHTRPYSLDFFIGIVYQKMQMESIQKGMLQK